MHAHQVLECYGCGEYSSQLASCVVDGPDVLGDLPYYGKVSLPATQTTLCIAEACIRLLQLLLHSGCRHHFSEMAYGREWSCSVNSTLLWRLVAGAALDQPVVGGRTTHGHVPWHVCGRLPPCPIEQLFCHVHLCERLYRLELVCLFRAEWSG